MGSLELERKKKSEEKIGVWVYIWPRAKFHGGERPSGANQWSRLVVLVVVKCEMNT